MTRDEWRAVVSTVFDLAIYLIFIYVIGELIF